MNKLILEYTNLNTVFHHYLSILLINIVAIFVPATQTGALFLFPLVAIGSIYYYLDLKKVSKKLNKCLQESDESTTMKR